jgi:hypothetical protein
MSGVCCLSFLDASAHHLLICFWALSWQITREEFHTSEAADGFSGSVLQMHDVTCYIFGKFFIDFEVALQTDLRNKLVDCHRKGRSTESPP